MKTKKTNFCALQFSKDQILDGFVKSPSAALHFNPALLDKRLRILE